MKQFYLIKEKVFKNYYIVKKIKKSDNIFIYGDILFWKNHNNWEKPNSTNKVYTPEFNKTFFYIIKRYENLNEILIDIPELIIS